MECPILSTATTIHGSTFRLRAQKVVKSTRLAWGIWASKASCIRWDSDPYIGCRLTAWSGKDVWGRFAGSWMTHARICKLLGPILFKTITRKPTQHILRGLTLTALRSPWKKLKNGWVNSSVKATYTFIAKWSATAVKIDPWKCSHFPKIANEPSKEKSW